MLSSSGRTQPFPGQACSLQTKPAGAACEDPLLFGAAVVQRRGGKRSQKGGGEGHQSGSKAESLVAQLMTFQALLLPLRVQLPKNVFTSFLRRGLTVGLGWGLAPDCHLQRVPRASCVLGECCTTELQPQPAFEFY